MDRLVGSQVASNDVHEDLKRGTDAVEVPKDRSFGFVFCGFFAILAAILGWNGSAYWTWSLGLSLAFLVVALIRPALLAPLNRLWMAFGALLHKVVSPLVMGMLFYLTVTPTGLILRLLGKDHLRLKLDPEAESYWIGRDPPGPDPKTMRDVY